MAPEDLPQQPGAGTDEPDQESDQDSGPPGDGMPGRVHAEDPAEGPDEDPQPG